MEKLKKAGLHGSAVIQVSGSLTRRYNQCLSILGIPPTSLERFTVDGIGWSPEVAQEKKNNYYLNIGEANSNAIIISPAQYGKAVHMPFHSFDRDIMHTVFKAYPEPIRDITKDSAICVHFDQNIDAYHNPLDLLRYKTISVSFKLVNDLDKKQEELEEMIALFNEENNFIDRTLHTKILEFANTYGDLRDRKLSLDSFQLEVNSFYTRAFGGVFVLRDFVKDIIIFESEDSLKKAIKDTIHDVMLFHMHHKELIETLLGHSIIAKDFRTFAKTDRYKRIKNHMLIENLKELDHPINEVFENPFLYKKYLNLLDSDLIKKVTSIEIYNRRRIVERELQPEEVIDEQYLKIVHDPHSSLELEHKYLIWKLLIKIAPEDPLHMYWYDKDKFYDAYLMWKPTYQDWVIETILKNNKNSAL